MQIKKPLLAIIDTYESVVHMYKYDLRKSESICNL